MFGPSERRDSNITRSLVGHRGCRKPRFRLWLGDHTNSRRRTVAHTLERRSSDDTPWPSPEPTGHLFAHRRCFHFVGVWWRRLENADSSPAANALADSRGSVFNAIRIAGIISHRLALGLPRR